MSVPVCLSLCVCLFGRRAYLRNHNRLCPMFITNVNACYLYINLYPPRMQHNSELAHVNHDMAVARSSSGGVAICYVSSYFRFTDAVVSADRPNPTQHSRTLSIRSLNSFDSFRSHSETYLFALSPVINIHSPPAT